MRKRIFEIIEVSEENDTLSNIYDIFMLLVIIASLIPLAFKIDYTWLDILDKVCMYIFIADYILRLITADYKYGKKSISSFLRYPFSFMAIIDLISILPSISLINDCFKVLRLTRIIRCLRVFRIFKTVRYSKNIQIILKVLKNSKKSLATVGILAITYILISALIVINVEPESFNNYFDAIYWATISLTTLGYGDIYPVTTIGRVVTMLSSVFGIAIVALPSGIITAEYMSEIKNEEKSDNCH